VDHETVFALPGSNSTQQLDSAIFMWVSIYPPRFQTLLVRNLIEEAGKSQDCPTPSLVGRSCAAAANIVQLESRHNQHWPTKST